MIKYSFVGWIMLSCDHLNHFIYCMFYLKFVNFSLHSVCSVAKCKWLCIKHDFDVENLWEKIYIFHAIRTLCMSFCMIKSNFYFCIIIRARNHFQLRVTLKERLHSKMCYMWTLYFCLRQEFQHIALLFS